MKSSATLDQVYNVGRTTSSRNFPKTTLGALVGSYVKGRQAKQTENTSKGQHKAVQSVPTANLGRGPERPQFGRRWSAQTSLARAIACS
jgi:hypothetical protein